MIARAQGSILNSDAARGDQEFEKIFVLRQQLLIHRPGNVGKDVHPIHNGPLAATVPERRRDRPRICPKVCRTAIRPADK